MNENEEEKALLMGILHMHVNECPNQKCLSKHNDPIYLPLTKEWSMRDKEMINDPIFLKMFIIVVYNFFLSLNYYSADMMINVSLYYLISIGNVSQSIYFYNKAKDMKMSWKEQFSFKRLGITIAKSLVEKFRMQNEPCYSLEDLNTSLYFKYEELSFQFMKEVSNDLEHNLQFWKTLKQGKYDIINYNNIFCLVDKIRLTKIQVDLLFKRLFEIFNGVNDLFDLYLNYVEIINDDDALKRDLEGIKRKNDTSAEITHYNNYYTILFNKETGIIIGNGDKGKEGIIEKNNKAADAMFGYETGKLKGMNVSMLMPKILQSKHKCFMEHYFQVGEKRIIDQKDYKTYAKDKDNAIFVITLLLKLFPMLNDNIYFVSLVLKEKIDDIILTDNRFNIQGMSQQLMNKLCIESKHIFQNHDIPFYVICKQFVNFYKNFLQIKQLKKRPTVNRINYMKVIDSETTIMNGSSLFAIINEEDTNNQGVNENVEINENVELEYSIRIPQFIVDYMIQDNQKEKKGIEERNHLSMDEQEENMSIDYDDDLENNEELSESDDQKLINNTNNNNNNNQSNTIKTVHSIKKARGSISINADNKTPAHSVLKSSAYSIGKCDKKVPEAEQNFQKCLDKFKTLFINNSFHELEEYIDSFFDFHQVRDYKFNFTFNRFKYGNKEVSYVIRCIDNKGETELISDSYDSFKETPLIQTKKRENHKWLKELNEQLSEERLLFINKQEEFIRMSIEDSLFQNKLLDNKEDIIKMSRIFNPKKSEAVIEDENSSQSSSAGYSEDLLKKNKIEEIRSGAMKKVSQFYMLKYYRFIILITILIAILFSGFYIYEIYANITDLHNVLELTNRFYQKTNWITSLLSSLLSLNAMYFITQNDYPFQYASFIPDHHEFVNLIQNSSLEWCSNISSYFGIIESIIVPYLGNNSDIFWGVIDVMTDSEIKDQESYPLALEQIISNDLALLKNELFLTRLFNKDPGDLLTNNLMNYHLMVGVKNIYHIFLRIEFDKLLKIPNIFEEYNKKTLNKLTNVIMGFCAVFVALLILYSILLYYTNKKLGEGFEKVAKIKTEKIDEIILKISSFQAIFKRFQDFSLSEGGTITGPEIQNEEEKVPLNPNNQKQENAYNIDNKQDIKLNLLSASYLQVFMLSLVIIMFITPIFLTTEELINNTNTLLVINRYIYGNLILTTCSLIELKVSLLGMKKNTTIDYATILGDIGLKDVVVNLQKFDQMMVFFNDLQTNICKATYLDQQSPDFIKCSQDKGIKVLNNTMSIMQMITKRTLTALEKLAWDIQNVPNYNPMIGFSDPDYTGLEMRHFYYVIPLSNNVAVISMKALMIELNSDKITLLFLLIFMIVAIMIHFTYVWIIFLRKIIHLLSVSRCVLKIIPINLIHSTQEIYSWIESMD